MSKTLFREILFTSDLTPVELPNSTETEVPSVLMYIGKQRDDDPLRIQIEEIVPVANPTIIDPVHYNAQNPTLGIENNYQDLMGIKACLDNFVDETISCDGAKHEAYVPLEMSIDQPDDLFPLVIEVQGERLLFPEGTRFSDFQARLFTYGVIVGRYRPHM